MYDNKTIIELANLSQKSAQELTQQIRIFDEIMQKTVQQANEGDKQAVEELFGIAQQAINLAKTGKVDQANETIRNFENARKSTKESL
jgi:hypothetical protein